ncbi:type II toxin-antitoxin system VapC family toxin [uncultured Mucilaginibacter sp.]|uniref:type II toxin-antitoxin system VapC family toxin n=1 Tax=uncultured Mucilaginibacter sp. TaxID=797541 RepID=UPI00262B1D8B|nr:type II toxin-antitoxin system VapC family toxin [uncultured Mucilaginibacter sp.]
MDYLLDTQIIIWALEDNPKLKTSLRILIEDFNHQIFVSQFSLMELSIKLKLSKLPAFIVSIDFIANQLLADGFDMLPLKNEHIYAYQSIPLFEEHRDPFDRFLLATALSEQIPIISVDKKFLLYQPLVNVIH